LYLHYLQGLILQKKYKKALRLSQEDVIWVNHATGRNDNPDVQYLQAVALYKLNQPNEAVKVLLPLKHHALSIYLLSRIYIDQGNFKKAKAALAGFIQPYVHKLPTHLYLPFQEDHLIDDDLTLLKAYVDLRLALSNRHSLSKKERTRLAAGFLNVPRYFPFSKSSTLFSSETIKGILNFVEKGDAHVFDQLFRHYTQNFL